jgi:hypothetical protein
VFCKAKIFISLLLLLLITVSCKEAKEYFHDPETEPIRQTVKATAAIGYSASVAMSVMSGEEPPYVLATGDCSDYPCTFLVYIDINKDNPLLFSDGNVGQIVVAGLMADEDAAIITIVLSDINIATQDFTLLSVHTIPVIREEDKFFAVFTDMDINIGADSDTLLNLNLSQKQIDDEISRAHRERPSDLYVAVDENVWFIDIDQNDTYAYFGDDIFSITGGGQIVEVMGASGGIIHQAMLNVELEQGCFRNPVSGYALIKNTSVEERKIPELGTAIFGFHGQCDGQAHVEVATGVYLRANGKSFDLGFGVY